MSEPLHKTLTDIVDFLNDQGVPFAVIGGIATSVRGEPRFTAAVDIVIGTDVDRCLELLGAVEDSAFRPLFREASKVVQTAFLLPLRHRQTRIKVDLAVGLTGFERQTIHRATTVELADRAIPIATAEDLASGLYFGRFQT